MDNCENDYLCHCLKSMMDSLSHLLHYKENIRGDADTVMKCRDCQARIIAAIKCCAEMLG